jgi:hypothetical protein
LPGVFSGGADALLIGVAYVFEELPCPADDDERGHFVVPVPVDAAADSSKGQPREIRIAVIGGIFEYVRVEASEIGVHEENEFSHAFPPLLWMSGLSAHDDRMDRRAEPNM